MGPPAVTLNPNSTSQKWDPEGKYVSTLVIVIICKSLLFILWKLRLYNDYNVFILGYLCFYGNSPRRSVF